MAKSYCTAVCFLGLLSLAAGTFGQTQEFYPFRKYSQSEGLSSYNITKILKDKYGFIWVATQDGLNCFDGKSFRIFNKEGRPEQRLNGNTIMDMAEDPKGEYIWLATSYGGVERVSTSTHSMSPLPDFDAALLQFKDKWVHAVSLSNNILWVGTYSGLYAYDLTTHSFLNLSGSALNPKEMKVGKLICDSAGRVWACCDGQGIYVFEGGTGQFKRKLEAPLLNFFGSSQSLVFWNIAQSAIGDIAIATNWGLRLFHHDELLQRYQLPPAESTPFSIEVFSCTYDQAGNIWLSDAHGLYRLTSDGKIIRVAENTNASDRWQSSIYSLYADDKHFIWVGSEEGLSYFNPAKYAFARYYKSYNTGTKIQHAFSLCPVNDSFTYCGAANGLYRINTRNYLIDKLDETGSCYLICPLPDGRYLVSNSKGCFTLQHQSLRPVNKYYSELAPLKSDLLCCWSRFNDSILVMGSELHKGVYVWNQKTHQLTRFDAGNSGLQLDDGLVDAIYTDRKGRLWVLSVATLFQLDPHTGRARAFHLKVPGLGSNASILFDICETRDRFWIAAYGTGIIETDLDMNPIRVVSEKDGLSNNGVYRVFSFHDSLILVTSNNGLSILHASTGKFQRYFEADGLQSNSFEQFCGFAGADTLYAGGVNGFTIIYPGHISHNPHPPQVYFTQVETESQSGRTDTNQLHLRSLTIPSNAYQTTVHFVGLNFSNPQRTTYAYQISELHTDWINLGSQNFINLIGINPGSYTLQVRSANEEGIWDPGPIELHLRFLPHWYQTNWFKLCLIALTAGTFYGLYRYRISQYRKQQQIRRDIANDLHDDLGSTLNTVKVLAHVAKRSTEKEKHLDQIENSLSLATSGLRDILWVLDDARDSIEDLIERIKTFALPAATAQGIRFEIRMDDYLVDRVLSKAEKRNLLMVIKETINNSIKYAESRCITLDFAIRNNKLNITLRDDGIGFDIAAATAGNGLKNIYYRARQIRYGARIDSGKGQGTTVHLTQE